MNSIRAGEMLREFGGKVWAIQNCWKGIAAQKRRINYNEQGMATRCEVSKRRSPVTQPAALHRYRGISLVANACAARGTGR